MNAIKKFLAAKGVGYYLTLVACVLAAIALVLYGENGITKFSAKLDTSAIVCLWITIVLLAGSLVYELKQVKFAAYFVCLFGFFGFIRSQATYIANVFVAIDGNTFSEGFIATAVIFFLAFVFALLSAILIDWKPWARKKASSSVKERDEETAKENE